MGTSGLMAEWVFCVHLRSYGFFHAGRDRAQGQVLKRTWEYVPGGTLYGAVAAALIRQLDPGVDLARLDLTRDQGEYLALLRAVQARQIRFTPLLPSASPLTSGAAFCQRAMQLQNTCYDNLFHTTPHAPIDRASEQIHGDQLFAVRTHRPVVDYYGFIFGMPEQRAWLESAFGLFPLIPFGGRGKFSLVEAALVAAGPLADFRQGLDTWAMGCSRWVCLLTPSVLPAGGVCELLSDGCVEEMALTEFQRYRVWRTGLYFNGECFDAPVGLEPGYANEQAGFLAGGTESVAAPAVPAHSRFRLKSPQDAARWFIDGTGHPGWSYLGWGQVVIE